MKKNSRHIRIGTLGSIGSGKTELVDLLVARWRNSRHIEESFGKNPYLPKFYENPKLFSFKSEEWFLDDKMEKITKSDGKETEFFDPDIEMDLIYAQTHNSMEWMSDVDLRRYKEKFNLYLRKNSITRPDFFLLTNAPYEVLINRVEERIEKGGRDFEKWILKKYPHYLKELSENVDRWKKENINKFPILEINTGYYDFSLDGKKEEALSRIESHISLWLLKNPMGVDGAKLKFPMFPIKKINEINDKVPGSGILSGR